MGRPLQLPRMPDTQHNAVVWGIDRRNETLSLRVDSLVPRSMYFNVCFTVQAERAGALRRAAIAAQVSLQSSNSWMRSILFPNPSDGSYQVSLNKAHPNLKLSDPSLNYEQLRAVNNVVNEQYGAVPYVISGPPGTGKTKTIVESALQLLRKDTAAHLLICAPSDPAADTLLQRLAIHLRPNQLLRLIAPSRNFPEVPNNVLPYCCVDDGMFSLPSFAELMRLKIVVTTCQDAEILLQARVDNRALFELEKGVHRAIHPFKDETPVDLHWTGLLMDEAAQATELEALVPLLVVAPPDDRPKSEQSLPIYVMAGDQHQLGPRTASKDSGFQRSLFERLLDRPFYSEHPLARSKSQGGIARPLTQDMLPILRPAFTNLIRNYRSHAAILAVPSYLFYNDTLEFEATNTNSLLRAPVWKDRKWPVIFASQAGPDEVEKEGGGWYNVSEAQLACQYAHSFLHTGMLQSSEICIMSPFRAQVRLLRQTARRPDFAMSEVSIGPLEAFQGLESRLVILCTTRTRDRFIVQDIAKGLGVIHEPRRFNVALTRARHGLVVIGNPHVLQKDEHWTSFMAFCRRNGLWDEHSERPWTPPTDAKTPFSRIERQLLHSKQMSQNLSVQDYGESRMLGFPDDDETELWRLGTAAAHMVLQEDSDLASEEHSSFDEPG